MKLILLTPENIININTSNEVKKILFYWSNKYGTFNALTNEKIKIAENIIENITFDLNNIKSNMTVKTAIKKSRFRLCNIFPNDFEDAKELEKMTLKELHTNLSYGKYWDMFRNIDTALRHQLSYVVAVANGDFPNMTPAEIYTQVTKW